MCCARPHWVRRRHGKESSVTSTLRLGPQVTFTAKVSLWMAGLQSGLHSPLHGVGGVGFVPVRVDSVPLAYWWRLCSGDTQRFKPPRAKAPRSRDTFGMNIRKASRDRMPDRCIFVALVKVLYRTLCTPASFCLLLDHRMHSKHDSCTRVNAWAVRNAS